MTRHFAYDERWNGAAIDEREWHFHRRLLDRYGIVLGPGDYSHMLERIRSGKALLVKTVARNRGVYRCRVRSTTEVVFVVSDGKWLFTAYPTNKHIRTLAQSVEKRRREEKRRMREQAEQTLDFGDQAGMEETLHLMASPANAKHLLYGIKELDARRSEEHELIRP